ncbi:MULTISPECIES: SpoIIE family protein phosphatase [Streptomyces]|uniref:protein-serine/threonine phosphatase n=1 Tax=Streptomyces xanthii TaxID=2768069 RepID=A0A7H1BGT4_9ACTN|nr:SpoIIE family protein phosphatase [Streptomyces xanthii]
MGDGVTDPARPARGADPSVIMPAGVLLDLLGVCAVVLDDRGRIVLWSPQAEDVFGYSAEEALGQYAASLLVSDKDHDLVNGLFAQVMATGTPWAGAFPVVRRDGTRRLVEFRNMRLEDDEGAVYALGMAADQSQLKELEAALALSDQLVSQSPVGLALLDHDLRYVLVNPALERINGRPASDHIGRHPRDLLTSLDVDEIESTLRRVLETGVPVMDRHVVGRTAAAPDEDHAWSVSYYRLEGANGQILGVANSVVDITERHRAAAEAERGRRRLALLAEASTRIGTTLEVEKTAQELADVLVPGLADIAAVDILDAALELRRGEEGEGPRRFRALGFASAYPNQVAAAADRIGSLAAYRAERLITRCATTGRPIMVTHTGPADLAHIARNPEAAQLLAEAGVHSYLAVPLIAHNQVLGVVDLVRARNPVAFDEDDLLLAGELAARTAIAVDNARWHQSVRTAAETLQRSLLPGPLPPLHGLDVACRYQPAQSSSQVGGDWYDVLPLDGGRTALVVGDVMGHGIDAAAAMGRLRTATQAYADLALHPAEILHRLDRTAFDLETHIATCVYAVYDPYRHVCRIANAGHMPPVLIPRGGPPRLVPLPSGAPLGVGGVHYSTTEIALGPGDRLVLYTDGLVETRGDPIDDRLEQLLRLLSEPQGSLDEVCTRLLEGLSGPGVADDVALLIAEVPVTDGTRDAA